MLDFRNFWWKDNKIFLFFSYAVKYNEQLILTLEEDEFSCKQRLAYKLEQVHNIMQGDAQ